MKAEFFMETTFSDQEDHNFVLPHVTIDIQA
jgi:hypothetical protein